ncbi:hypothetical protein BDZ94DRAFT_1267549 [Collybia nuda]|uniref:ubiquitinyl hydrolase 1 n=1 Tax=Collybia nuda TaxID=64659 RepID=A0A9P5XZV3_9AGAR|nr:hypothetical protein BDZ94DRAFT_1267549 [Collybia nuda]
MYPIPDAPPEDKLMSLPDMIFGGKLTSILVCQKCKHVSQTYEDFNDISLSLKAEDYHERKRDRFKNLAKRLASFPSTSLAVGSEIPRPSSVPPSPRERGAQQLGGHEEPPIAIDPRRRSLDIVTDPGQEEESERSPATSKEDIATMESDGSNVIVNGIEVQESKHIVIADDAKKDKKGKKDEGWAKLGRRISMTVGLGKAAKERGNHPRDSSRERSTSANLRVPAVGEERTSVDSSRSTPRTSTSEVPPSHTPAILLSRPSTPPPPRASEFVPSTRPPSPAHFINRSKSPKPPKPSSAELEYLRQILADIAPASSNPFALFKPGSNHHSSSNRSVSAGTPSSSTHNLPVWLNMNQPSGIEDCLRMFTAVENLDGENMVGCRRCWKIANGEYVSKGEDECADDDSDSVDHGDEALNPQPRIRNSDALPPSTSPSVRLPTSVSTPTVSYYKYSEDDTNDPNRSVSSLPSGVMPHSTSRPRTSEHVPSPLTRAHTNPTPGGMSIPVVSTTPPADPLDIKRPRPLPQTTLPSPRPLPVPPVASNSTIPTPVAQPTPRLGQVLSHLPPSTSASKDSLPIPKPRYQQPRSDVDSADDSSGSGAESENSVATSHRSIDSSSTSVGMDHHQPRVQVPTKKPSRPKPVIMRPAYKRYLIGTPPPVLVIHLKRFQQISKTHMLSFSHGFRKLDDYVTFPELLDLTPYLAPRKEDFGLGKKASYTKRKAKEGEKCMYRLYAVVVHIGNMLGGHYIAYTALPTPPPPQINGSSSSSDPPSSVGEPGHISSMPPNRPWAYISDTIVRLTTLEEVLKAKAYMCMYERI